MIGRTNVGGGGGGQTWSIRGWCETVGLSYGLLDDITEADMRTLMTKYASVAYFREWYATEPSMIDQFIANTYAMKWIGLRDYICDKLMAVADFKTKALASANWEYILKDHVPEMTSNTAPYGTASASTVEGANLPFCAFNGTGASWWSSYSSNAIGQYIQYSFVNPICVRKFYYSFASSHHACDVELSGSNDGTNFTSLGTFTLPVGVNNYYSVSNENYYLHYRITCKSAGGNHGGASTARLVAIRIQFYGRSLNVSVPKMTSDTAPYGEAFGSGIYNINYQKYQAFNEDYTSFGWCGVEGYPQYVGYDFGRAIKVLTASVYLKDNSSRTITQNFKFQGSNSGASSDWNDISGSFTYIGYNIKKVYVLNSSEAYRYFRFYLTGGDGSTIGNGYHIQFFGVDYSERTDRTYLYDHGVEVVPLSGNENAQRGNGFLDLQCLGTYRNAYFITPNGINLTNYSLIRAVISDCILGDDDNIAVYGTYPTSSASRLALQLIMTDALPNNASLDVSSINQIGYVRLNANSSSTASYLHATEWWLE